jgi:hypothetical protein
LSTAVWFSFGAVQIENQQSKRTLRIFLTG